MFYKKIKVKYKKSRLDGRKWVAYLDSENLDENT